MNLDADETQGWYLGFERQIKGKVISWTDEGKPLMMFGTHQDLLKERKLMRLYTKVKKNTGNLLSQPTKV
jgi:hypothetical protein